MAETAGRVMTHAPRRLAVLTHIERVEERLENSAVTLELSRNKFVHDREWHTRAEGASFGAVAWLPAREFVQQILVLVPQIQSKFVDGAAVPRQDDVQQVARQQRFTRFLPRSTILCCSVLAFAFEAIHHLGKTSRRGKVE